MKLEFRALETEWNASLAHLSAAAESIIESLVRTELNQLTTAHYATRMRIGSLKGLREAISSGKVIVTASFRRLESAISQRDGEASVYLAHEAWAKRRSSTMSLSSPHR